MLLLIFSADPWKSQNKEVCSNVDPPTLSLGEKRKLRVYPRFIAKFVKSQSSCFRSFLNVGFGTLSLFTASDHGVWPDVFNPLAHPPIPWTKT